jgi:hypothetical protein
MGVCRQDRKVPMTQMLTVFETLTHGTRQISFIEHVG